jgi:hypothetical protein
MARISASGAGGASTDIPANSVYTYNEVTNVNPGIETIIATYNVNAGANCYLQMISASGTNKAEFRIYKNTDIIDKKYTYYTEFNTEFDYFTGNNTAPGIKLESGDVIYIKAIQNRPTTCDFNAIIQVLEVSI